MPFEKSKNSTYIFPDLPHTNQYWNFRIKKKGVHTMRLEKERNTYDDGNIPEIDMPKDFDPMEVSIPAPYPINSAPPHQAEDAQTQGSLNSTGQSHTAQD